MFLRVVEMSTVFSLPVAYSFWASMIMRVLSEGEAVLGLTPMRSLKDDGAIVVVVVVLFEEVGC